MVHSHCKSYVHIDAAGDFQYTEKVYNMIFDLLKFI